MKARKSSRKLKALVLTALMGFGVCGVASAANQTGTTFSKGQIDGKTFGFSSSNDFKKYNVWDSATKTYHFDLDSTINTKSITGNGADVNVNAAGVTLTLNSTENLGIQSYKGRGYKADPNYYAKLHDVTITAKKVVVNVDRTSKLNAVDSYGIISGSSNGKTVKVTGDVDINIASNFLKEADGSGDRDPAVTCGIGTLNHGRVVIDGNAKIRVKVPTQKSLGSHGENFLSHYYVHGISAMLNYDGDTPGGNILVTGDVDIESDGTGVRAGTRSTVTIGGGGKISINKDNGLPHFALNAEEATINMNVKLDAAGNVIGAGDHKTEIYGNVGLIDREGTATTFGNTPTRINVGLTTADSVFKGVVLDNYKEQGKNEPDKKAIREATGLNLYLQNGAEWHNESWGTMIPTRAGFSGSKLRALHGGADAEHAGKIFQNDANPISVEKYSGYTNVLYKHDATDPTKIEGGDFIIKKAEGNSGITLRTDAAGLDTSSGAPEDKNKVNATLHALAQKLYYSAAKDGEETLKGKVEIAEGLTTPSAALRTESMTYKRENGQGQYAYQELPPSVTYGPSETVIMRETKTALTAGALAWRNNNNDLARRMGELRLKNAERGAWVKYLGGKTFMNDQGVDMSQSYGIVQVGYDRDVKDWTVGALVDYGKMKSSSAGSSADDRLVGLAVYGVRQQKDGSYLDLIVRANRLSGDFTVRNSAVELQGDHKNFGISASAEYGKRFAQPGGFYIEPSAELTLGHLQGDDSTARNGSNILHVRQDAFNSAVGKLGLGIGQETKASNVFLKLGLAHEFAGDLDVRYHEPGYTPKSTHVSLKDTWMELEAGGSVLLSDRTYAYTSYTRSFRTDVHDHWRVDAGVRFSF
ncbi:autotransporter outer membrane beta-barrel domain-containing protein [Selenomonas sp.]|uniref:autotransporter outer membrane beta-barrel domain-containing protein n=1 Tax=Selenomonas sp. TaxID=2053611 RepID=UPI003FA20AFD